MKRGYLILLLLVLLVSACGAKPPTQQKATWDNAKWDHATWQ